MCTDIDYIPHLMMITDRDLPSSSDYNRRNSWTLSISSSSSSSTMTNSTNLSSWLERKLFSHFKRFFQRNSSPAKSDTSSSSRRPSSSTEEVISIPVIEEKLIEEEVKPIEQAPQPVPSTPIEGSPKTSRPDSLYDYDSLLTRCLQRQEQDRNELISRCQTPVTIPHADLTIGHSRTIVRNWKLYVRLFRALNRDSQLFQQYINQSYSCQSSINQHEQLTFNVRTTKTTFDNLLKTFLHAYVTCLACQKAQTHLIKSTGLWRIECQLCGSQRSVKRLRWKS